MRRIMLLLALLMAATATTPAHATSDASVTVAYDLRTVHDLDGNEYVVAYCEATSTAGTSDDLITQTGVTCSVNGIDVFGVGVGNKAVIVATHNVPRPVQFCYEGVALLLDTTPFTYFVKSPRTCFTY